MKRFRLWLCMAALGALMAIGGATLAHDVVQPPVEISSEGPRPQVTLEVLPDPVSGYNAHVITAGINIMPEHIGQAHTPGEGHATLYVNGQRLTRIYGEWVHLGQLPAGRNIITVTLNANNLANLTYGGQIITADAVVTIDDAAASTNDFVDMNTIESAIEVGSDGPIPALTMNVTPDPVTGWNLHFDLSNFSITPGTTADNHVPGEGYIHLYVDGKNVGRIYDEWYHLPGYDGEGHEIIAVLNANTHAPLASNGQFIRAIYTTQAENALTSKDIALLSQVPIPNLTLGNNANYGIALNENGGQFNARDGKGAISADANGSMAASGNDIWGWTDPMTGQEIALMGLTNGVSFVDVTTPEAPVVLGFLPTETFATTWRDIKVYNDYAFIVADASGSHGVQIFDLTQLREVTTPQTFSATTLYTGVGSVHNIVINEDTGYAYLAGGNNYGGSLHIVDISDPLNPTFVSALNNRYSHDAQVVIYNGPDTEHVGREIAIGSDESRITISDVTDKESLQILGEGFYSEVAYTHQGWLTEDHAYFISNDELDELNGGDLTNTYIWDVRDLDAPVLLNTFVNTGFNIDHNLYVHNGLVYQANYTAGLRVLDASNIASGVLEEIAFYDTYTASNNNSFNGAWSVYPFFESGTIIVSDINTGLYVLRLQEDVTYALAPLDLTVEGDDSGAPILPTFAWRHQEDATQNEVPADWYRLRLERDGAIYLDQWVEQASVCEGVLCQISGADYLPSWGLENGTYGWWIEAYYADTGTLRLSNRAPLFTVDLAAAAIPAGINVTPNEGRPTLTWDADPNALWAQIWIGPNATFGNYFTWVGEVGAEAFGLPAYSCDDITCTLDVAWDFVAGDYQVWMQAWGPGGASDWVQGPTLTVPATAPGDPTTLGVTDPAANNPEFTWTSGPASTWFELVLEPDATNPEWTWSVGWFPASDVGCAASASVCTYTSSALAGGVLPDGDYVMRVRAYGPGGITDYVEAAFSYTGGA